MKQSSWRLTLGIVDVFGEGWGEMHAEELNSWMVENELQHFPESFIILNPNVY